MSKYDINRYLHLLNLSYEYLKYCNRRYNQNMDSVKYKYKLDYHIFTFAQLVFALRDRLITDVKKDEKKILNFFEYGVTNPKTPTGVVIRLSREWRHKEGLDLRQHFTDLKEISPCSCEETVEMCTKQRLCPYEISVMFAKHASVIIADYYMIFHPSIRQKFFNRAEKELGKAIIIIISPMIKVEPPIIMLISVI